MCEMGWDLPAAIPALLCGWKEQTPLGFDGLCRARLWVWFSQSG